MPNIDPNPENYVCAGIIHTQAAQIGTLVRMEPNKQAKVFVHSKLTCQGQSTFPFQMYRLTIRSSRDGVAGTLSDLLIENF